MTRNRHFMRARSQSWDAVAHWYAGWTGTNGSRYHRTLAVPLLLELLAPKRGEHIADLGCGPGILAPRLLNAAPALSALICRQG